MVICMISSKITKITLAFLIVALICVPVNAHDESAEDVTAVIVEDSEELVALCEEIHDQTEPIADDDALDQDIRDLAEGIHLFSHELEPIAKHILEHAQELQGLVASGSGDSAAMEEAIDEINEHCDEFNALLNTKHEDIHDLVFNAPETHEEYADETHDAAHDAGDVVDHILEHTEELAGMLPGVAAGTSSSSSKETCVNTGDVSVEVEEIAEGSDELFALAESVLLDTKAIVKDDTVDQGIRDLAKTIHLVSHELEDIAADLQQRSAKLQTLAADSSANKAEIEEIITEIEGGLAEYCSKLEGQHGNIHELVSIAPDSREENADAVHDAAHDAENIADHLAEHLASLGAALNSPAETQTEEAQNPTGAEPKQAPGFGVFTAICAVFGIIGYLARRH